MARVNVPYIMACEDVINENESLTYKNILFTKTIKALFEKISLNIVVGVQVFESEDAEENEGDIILEMTVKDDKDEYVTKLPLKIEIPKGTKDISVKIVFNEILIKSLGSYKFVVSKGRKKLNEYRILITMGEGEKE